MIGQLKFRLYYYLFSFLLLFVASFGLAYAKEPVYIQLTYKDLLAVKIWGYSQYNNKKLVSMIKSDIIVYAEIFTPILYQKYQGDKEALQKHFQRILNVFIGHLNHYYQNHYYLDKTVTLGKFDSKNASFSVDIPKRFFIKYNGDLPYSINGYNFLPSYYVDLKGNYKTEFTYSQKRGKEIQANPNQKACLRVFLKPQSLSQVNLAHRYVDDNYSAETLSFHLYPNKSCN
ncbi:hypothetical protein L3V83_01170 [Thiotrichales bacterium 19X7-9]|nr:hypothetical protein [Thiotrichales bacterium 19X7-9]